jgi:hypothetical protein
VRETGRPAEFAIIASRWSIHRSSLTTR